MKKLWNFKIVLFCLLPIIIPFIAWYIPSDIIRIILAIIWIPITIVATKIMEDSLKK